MRVATSKTAATTTTTTRVRDAKTSAVASAILSSSQCDAVTSSAFALVELSDEKVPSAKRACKATPSAEHTSRRVGGSIDRLFLMSKYENRLLKGGLYSHDRSAFCHALRVKNPSAFPGSSQEDILHLLNTLVQKTREEAKTRAGPYWPAEVDVVLRRLIRPTYTLVDQCEIHRQIHSLSQNPTLSAFRGKSHEQIVQRFTALFLEHLDVLNAKLLPFKDRKEQIASGARVRKVPSIKPVVSTKKQITRVLPKKAARSTASRDSGGLLEGMIMPGSLGKAAKIGKKRRRS